MKYYVYELQRPDGLPFYIGKGTGKRILSHEMEARRGCRCYKCNTIRKIWRDGWQIGRKIVFTTESEQEAFIYESRLIAFYGRDALCNQTDGGDGASGYRPSEETRRKRGQTMKRVWSDPETHERRSRSIRRALQDAAYRIRKAAESAARWASPEYHDRTSAAVRAARQTPESRAKTSEASKRLFDDPAYRQEKTEHLERLRNDPETKAKQRASMRAMLAAPEMQAQRRQQLEKARASEKWRDNQLAAIRDPEYRAAKSEEVKRRYESEEERAKTGGHSRAAWASDPERRERQREAARQRWADPEYKARVAAKISETKRKKSNDQ